MADRGVMFQTRHELERRSPDSFHPIPSRPWQRGSSSLRPSRSAQRRGTSLVSGFPRLLGHRRYLRGLWLLTKVLRNRKGLRSWLGKRLPARFAADSDWTDSETGDDEPIRSS